MLFNATMVHFLKESCYYGTYGFIFEVLFLGLYLRKKKIYEFCFF